MHVVGGNDQETTRRAYYVGIHAASTYQEHTPVQVGGGVVFSLNLFISVYQGYHGAS